MKQSKLLVGVLFLATTLSAYAETKNISNPAMDYMDEGVRVIVTDTIKPTILKSDDKVCFRYSSVDTQKNQTKTNEDLAELYTKSGFNVQNTGFWTLGFTALTQELNFSGNIDQLEDMYFHKDDEDTNATSQKTKRWFTTGATVVAGVLLGKSMNYSPAATTGMTATAVLTGTSMQAVSTSLETQRKALFDNYKDIPAKSSDHIEIYTVSVNKGPSSKVIFITDKGAEVDYPVVLRG